MENFISTLNNLKPTEKQGEGAFTNKKAARIEPENTIEAPSEFFKLANLELANGASNQSINGSLEASILSKCNM